MEEKLNLENILTEIDNIIEKTKAHNQTTANTIEELKAYLQENATKIADDEIIKIYGQVNALFSSVEDGLSTIKRLEQIKPSPYFGKVTYNELGEDYHAYIGLSDVISTKGTSLVSDWRAPISSLFYSSKLGKTTYSVNDSEIEVDLKIKKQISIKNGELIYAYETNEKIDDEILLNVLREQKSSEHMKNIVSSIQNEQNEIIRQPAFFSIVINGVAGSGKTSIAMHRLAYLLYSEKETLKNENILILSPNELFSQYLSTLLPELGEENAETISFRTMMVESFPSLMSAENRSEMLEDIFVNNKNRLTEVQNKFIPNYAEKVMDFLSQISIEDEVQNLYLPGKKIDLKALPKKHSLTNENRFRIYRKIDYILDEIILEHFRKLPEEKQQENIDELKFQIEEKLLKKNLVKRFFEENNIEYQDNKILYDQISTYAFINFSILGFNSKPQYKEVFIDEIQDYDALSLKLIKELMPNAKFVIVGDINQNLISTNNNLDYLISLLSFAKTYSLSTCYRSTAEIATLANAIIDYHHAGKLIRNGEKPKIHICKDKFTKINEICAKYDSNTKIAIICKSKKEAQSLAENLPEFGLITDESMKSSELSKNKIITTIYLSKGLEFDCVVLTDITDEHYKTQTELQLLYVMLTRALHYAHIILNENHNSILLDEKFDKYLEK